MMPTEQQVKEAYKAAVDEVKEYINSDELFNTFYAIRTKYNLHVDVAGNLALLINAVTLGLVTLTEFPQLLKGILTNATDADYQAILKSVNDDVFTAFRTQTKERVEEAKRKAEQEAKEDAELEKQLAEESKNEVPSVTPPAPPVAPSIVTQKVTEVSAPPRYHGTDPYREMAE